MKYGIAVAGTHGKTTTTSMVATVLSHGGIDPTVVIGGRLDSIGSNAKLGQGKFLVAEADESDGSFMKLSPTIAVVTNVDADHLDFYRDLEQIKESFSEFINKVPFFGVAVLCLDDANIQSMIPQVQKRFVTYGLSTQADFNAIDIVHREERTSFTVCYQGERLGRLSMRMPGQHNVLNALAAVAVAHELEIPFATITEAFQDFCGVQRRFQCKYQQRDIMVVDDYGHHPAEVRVTLAAARAGWDRRVVAVFQPHRHSRTAALFDDFVTAFYQADHLVVMDIYAAGEQAIDGVDAQRLVAEIHGHGHKDVHYLATAEEVVAHLQSTVQAGDLVITLGAGNVWQVGESLIEYLRQGDSD